MKEGIYRRGSNRARRREQECSPNQSFVLPSRRQARRRSASVLVVCLILCSVTWTLSRFRSPSPTSTESLPRQASARAVVFELFRHYRHLPAHNETFSVLAGPVHRRRRGLLEHSGTTPLTDEEIFSEEEPVEQLFYGQSIGGNFGIGLRSLRRRDGEYRPSRNKDQDSTAWPCGDSSSTLAALKPEWPVFGLHRESETLMESIYTKIVLGNPGTGEMLEYFLHVDTGSAHTWVNCIGSPVVGPGGSFEPTADSYLNCKTSRDVCASFQKGVMNNKHPCDRWHDFKCFYMYWYGDNTISEGFVINVDIRLDLSDGPAERRTIAIECSSAAGSTSDQPDDSDDFDSDAGPVSYTTEDGLLSIGRHPNGLLSQLYRLNLFSEYVLAICLEPRRVAPGSRGGRVPMEHTGFLSFGDS